MHSLTNTQIISPLPRPLVRAFLNTVCVVAVTKKKKYVDVFSEIYDIHNKYHDLSQ